MNTQGKKEPLLWITASTTPTPNQKRACIHLVTALAQDGWIIAGTESSSIGSLAARSTRAMGGQFENAPEHSSIHRNTRSGVRMAIPRRVWEAERSGLCVVTTARYRGRVIFRIDLTPATKGAVSPAPPMVGRQQVGVER